MLFFIHLESRRVDIAGITDHPNEQWMQQMARNATMEGCGALRYCRYLLHDRDAKYSAAFRAIFETGHVRTLPLPARSPNLNAYAERWVRSVKDECLSKIILFGDRSLRRAVSEMLRTTTLSEIIKESPTSCCSLMSVRCAAQDRCDAASGWVDFCAITIKRPRESPRHVGRGECCAWRSMPSYVLFVAITDGKLMSRGGCHRPAVARSPRRFCHRFDFLTLRGTPRPFPRKLHL